MSEVEAEGKLWPLAGQLEALEMHKPDRVRGANRLGALAFDDAPDQLKRVLQDLKDLRLEDWEALPRQVDQLPDILTEMDQIFGQMEDHTSATQDAAVHKGNYERRMTELFNQFRQIVHPLTTRARIRDELALGGNLGQDADRLQQLVASLQEQASNLEAEIGRIAPLAEASRETVLESGAAQLEAAYEDEAVRHERAWRQWLVALAIILVVAGGAGLWFVSELEPETDATNAQIATAIARDVLFVGLLLFAVRIASLQFRVHRHLGAVARNKAAALGTFNRIVAGQTEPEVRAAVAAALAQAVFSSEHTGFIGTGEDSVTLIERVAGPFVHRAGGG
jgi:hypothetical protein